MKSLSFSGSGSGGGSSFSGNYDDLTNTPPNSVLQLQNTSTQNLNSATSYTLVEIAGTVLNVGDASTDFSVASNVVTCNFTGLVKISASLYTSGVPNSSTPRVVLEGAVHHQGSPVGPVGVAYVRAVSAGHNEGNVSIVGFYLSVTSGDVLDVRCRRSGTQTSTVPMTAGTSFMVVERVE